MAGLDPAREPLGVERTVATRTDLIAVSGRIDRLDDRRGPDGSGELVVVDYKTGRHVLTVDDARTSLPLALYALAAERVMRRPCRRVELHHLPTGQVLAWEHTAESLARQLRRAEDIAAECAAADERFRGGPRRRPRRPRRPGLPDDRSTRSSRRALARGAAGATSGPTARRAARRPSRACPGTGSPRMPPDAAGVEGAAGVDGAAGIAAG